MGWRLGVVESLREEWKDSRKALWWVLLVEFAYTNAKQCFNLTCIGLLVDPYYPMRSMFCCSRHGCLLLHRQHRGRDIHMELKCSSVHMMWM